MNLQRIYPEDYPNNKLVPFTYTSDYYYDVALQSKEKDSGWTVTFQKTPFKQPFIKYIEDKVFKSYKENAEYYSAVNYAGKEIGLLCVGKQTWNNLLRVWDLYIDNNFQRRGLGTQLLQFAGERAKILKVRGIILECQSSNYPAIQFYQTNGFVLTGFDLICYSNTDIEKHEVRLEMAKLLNVKK